MSNVLKKLKNPKRLIWVGIALAIVAEIIFLASHRRSLFPDEDNAPEVFALATDRNPLFSTYAQTSIVWRLWRENFFERTAEKHQPIFLWVAPSDCKNCEPLRTKILVDKDFAHIVGRSFTPLLIDATSIPSDLRATLQALGNPQSEGKYPIVAILKPHGDLLVPVPTDHPETWKDLLSKVAFASSRL